MHRLVILLTLVPALLPLQLAAPDVARARVRGLVTSPPKHMVVVRGDRIIVAPKIWFRTNSSVIRRRSYPVLDAVAALLKARPALSKIEISGHHDPADQRHQYGRRLPYNRARSVAYYLIRHGVKRSRLEYRGYGGSRPLTRGRTNAERRRNRRIELRIIERKTKHLRIDRYRMDIRTRLQFAPHRARLLPASFAALDAVATFLQAHPELKRIQIEGRCVKQRPRGKWLASRRARAVRNYLIARGAITPRRLVSKGKSCPAPTSSGWSPRVVGPPIQLIFTRGTPRW